MSDFIDDNGTIFQDIIGAWYINTPDGAKGPYETKEDAENILKAFFNIVKDSNTDGK